MADFLEEQMAAIEEYDPEKGQDEFKPVLSKKAKRKYKLLFETSTIQFTLNLSGNKRKADEMDVDEGSHSNQKRNAVLPKFKPVDVESLTVSLFTDHQFACWYNFVF